MRRARFVLGLRALAIAGIVACGGVNADIPRDPFTDGGADGAEDAGSGVADARTGDATSVDATSDDAARPDAAPADAAPDDDSTPPDAMPPDAMAADATVPDAATDATPPADGGDAAPAEMDASDAASSRDAESTDAADASDAESADAADGGDAADTSVPPDMAAFVGRWSPSTGTGQTDCSGVISSVPPNTAAVLTFTEDSPDTLTVTSSGAAGCAIELLVSGVTASLAHSPETCGTVDFTEFNVVFTPAATDAGADGGSEDGAPPPGTLAWQLADTEATCVTTLDYTLVRAE